MSETLIECRERAAEALVPFLVSGADGDEAFALQAAYQAIDAYRPMTPREMQLAAQAVALGFAALACLRCTAGRNLAIETLLDLQDAAIKLDRQAQASIRALEARQRERQRAPQMLSPATTAWDERGFRRIMTLARRKLDVADATTPEFVPAPKPRRTALRLGLAEPMTIDVLARMASEHRRGTMH